MPRGPEAGEEFVSLSGEDETSEEIVACCVFGRGSFWALSVDGEEDKSEVVVAFLSLVLVVEDMIVDNFMIFTKLTGSEGLELNRIRSCDRNAFFDADSLAERPLIEGELSLKVCSGMTSFIIFKTRLLGGPFPLAVLFVEYLPMLPCSRLRTSRLSALSFSLSPSIVEGLPADNSGVAKGDGVEVISAESLSRLVVVVSGVLFSAFGVGDSGEKSATFGRATDRHGYF